MNVTLQNPDSVSALLTVELVKADYQEKVEKSLKQIKKTARMPGFRPGMVPMGMIQKVYGKSVLVDEVNKVLSEAVNKYIQDNQLHILGEPLPNEEKQVPQDLEKADKLEFYFDLALAPEVKVEATDKDKFNYYTVEVTDEMVNEQVSMYANRNGHYDQVQDYQGGDLLKGLLQELDENGNAKEDGIKVEGAVMMPMYIKDEAEKAKFEGAKVGDVLTFNPHKAWEGNEAELSSLLKIDKEAVADAKSDFTYQVEEISRYVPGDLTQELFDSVCGPGEVKSEDEFRAKVREMIEKQYASSSDYRFYLDARKAYVKKAGKLEFADGLLKRIMLINNPQKDQKFVDDNYQKSIDELSWQLVRDELAKQCEVKVERDDVLRVAKASIAEQFAQYGMMNVPDDVISNYADEQLRKEDSLERYFQRAVEDKLVQVLKERVKLTPKKVSVDEFSKLFDEDKEEK